LNDLLGAKEAGKSEALEDLPKDEAGRPERAPENFQPDVTEVAVSAAGKLPYQSPFPKPANVTHAMSGRAKRT
jgi:hypothetical protein